MVAKVVDAQAGGGIDRLERGAPRCGESRPCDGVSSGSGEQEAFTVRLGECDEVRTENSRATSFTDRPVSMTRYAASVLNSKVNLLRVAPTMTSFQPTFESACQISTFPGEPQDDQEATLEELSGWAELQYELRRSLRDPELSRYLRDWLTGQKLHGPSPGSAFHVRTCL